MNKTAVASGRTDRSEVAEARSNMYGFLATLYREAPTADLLRWINDPPVQAALADAGVTLDQDFFELPEEQLLLELAVEFTALFIGPGKHISPHESVHTRGGEGSLWGESTTAVRRFIESCGVEYRSEYRGIPDHISVEMEFMQAVVGREALAWTDGDTVLAMECLQTEMQFLNRHLTPWVPRFCEKVVATTGLPFYRDVARLTKEFIEIDTAEIADLIAEERAGVATNEGNVV